MTRHPGVVRAARVGRYSSRNGGTKPAHFDGKDLVPRDEAEAAQPHPNLANADESAQDQENHLRECANWLG